MKMMCVLCAAAALSAGTVAQAAAAATDRPADFAAALYRAVAEGRQGNVLVSPAGAEAMLGLLASGARGETAAAFARALLMEGADRHSVQDNLLHAREALESAYGDGAAASMTASLWLSSAFRPLPDFVTGARDGFNADVCTVRMGETARRVVNDYANRRTGGRIKTLLAKAPERNTPMLYVGTVLFDAEWSAPFLPQNTSPGVFHAAGGDVAAQFMRDPAREAAIGGACGCTVLRLPYRDGRLELLLLLPLKGVRLESVEARLGGDFLSLALEKSEFRKVDMSIPKFAFESRGDLRGALERMGLGGAFGEGADFSAAAEGPLWVSALDQAAMICVDEAGTKAASASGAAASQAQEQGEVRFVADRPFLFILRDVSSGGTLFIGRVAGP